MIHFCAVDALRGPLETDVRQAAVACWAVGAREVTVRGALKLRSHQLTLHEARFNWDAETQQLGAALQQWQAAAQGSVAAAALEARVAERRLIHTVFTCVPPPNPGKVLDWRVTGVAPRAAPDHPQWFIGRREVPSLEFAASIVCTHKGSRGLR